MAQVAVPAGRPVGKRRRGLRGILREMRREWTAYLFNAPGFILFAIFTVYAVSEAFILSFHRWNILEPQKPFVGLDNYREVLHDGAYWASIGHSAYFTVGSLIPTLVIGLALAILLNGRLRGVGLFRTAFYLPAITPLVISSLIWKWVYNGDYGLANYYLLKLHLISKPVEWLSNAHLAMPAVIVLQIWIGVGFSMVVYLAGLQAIPRELYEAAEVDGASRWRQFRKITLPLLAPTTIFLLVVQVIWLMTAFDQIFVMTNGGPPGPGGATTTVTYYLYTNAFRYYRMGYASALAWTLFVILFAVSYLQFRYYLKRVERT